jgi:carbon-monoxide dehydrogenase large subunit
MTLIGASVPDLESRRLVAGGGRYVEDLQRPGLLHLAIARSPWAHARITALDVTAARAMPGVAAVLTSRDMPATAATMTPSPRLPGLGDAAHPTLARDVVRYVGEPVAVVAADTQAAAWDAAQALQIDYDPLPAVADLAAALAPGAPLVHPRYGSNVLFTYEMRAGPDDEPAAARVVEAEMALPRVAAVPLEGRAVLAEPTADGRLLVWISTQAPHRVRERLAAMLGVAPQQVHVRTADVGGAFGVKGNSPCPEEFAAAWLAMQMHRPVRWIETRRDGLLTLPHGRGQRTRLRAGVDGRGRLLFLDVSIDADIGAYCLANSAGPSLRTANVITGPYRIPRVRVDIRGVATHCAPTSPYRGAGRPEATYYLERMIELIAQECGLDAVEVRRCNFVTPGEMPYDTGTGVVLDSGDYAAVMDRVLSLAGGSVGGRRDGAGGEAPSNDLLKGVGLATFAEVTGGWSPEYARVELHPGGDVMVASGISPHGQGTGTGLAQIAAEVLGVPLDRVVVVTGDTDLVPEGTGTFGSRSMVLGGAATDLAARALRRRLVDEASRRLEAATSDITIENGRAFVAGAPERAILLDALVGSSPWLEEARIHPDAPAVSFGAHLAEVDISRETGEVRVVAYTAVDDPGVIVNPALVEGQLFGGIIQGLGNALFEAVAYDQDGQALTATLMDYAVPKAHHVPAIRLMTQETPTPTTALGAKGVGEAGTVGALAAVANAVAAALRPLGVRHLDPPYTAQRVFDVLRHRRTIPPRRETGETAVGDPTGVGRPAK